MLLKKLAIFCLAAMLSACTAAKLEELRQISPRGSAFNVALAREYLAFSNSEAEQYDWVDSYHFADKGLRAAYNHTVKPEVPTDWNIDDQYISELQEARVKLMKKLD